MPWRYRIDKELGTVFSEGYGVFTEADLKGHQDALLADSDFDPAYRQLYDLSEVTRLAVSSAFINSFARRAVFSAASKRAIVAPEDVVFGSARSFEAWHDSLPSEVRVFRGSVEARRWLDLDP